MEKLTQEDYNAKLKHILESPLLSDEEKVLQGKEFMERYYYDINDLFSKTE